VEHLVGIPYEKADCWRLTQKYYREILGIELKHYFEGPTPEREAAGNLIYTNKGDFKKVEGGIEVGDILLMRIWGVECHVAVYVGEGKILHTMEGTGSNIDRFERWAKMVTGIYRLAGKQ
jgi:cell wall-associated NlpC family hydrolase